VCPQLHNTRYTQPQPGALSVTYNLHNMTCCHNTKLM